MKNTLPWLWPLFPCITLSGLIHTTDSDIEGFAGLFASPAVMVSVLVWSAPIAVCAYLLLAAYLAGGNRWFLLSAVPTSAALGTLLAVFASTAADPIQFLWSVAGSSLVVLGFLSLAVLPSAMVLGR